MKNSLFFFFSIIIICCLIPSAVYAQSPDFSYTQTCYGNQTTLVASSSLPDTSIASWQWDLDENGTYEVFGKTIISLLTLNDTLAVKLKIVPNAGLADSITKNVIIDPLPQVNFIANNLCESYSATYISQSTVSSGIISQFLWDFNNDGITDDNSNDTVNYTCGPAQTYITKLTCISDKGCAAFTQKVTTVYSNPTAAFSTASACANDTATFANTSTAANLDFYLWKYGDGNQAVTSGNATHIYTASGTYTVTLIAVTQNGCRDTTYSSITINSIPSVSTMPSVAICQGDSTALTANATNGLAPYAYQWSPAVTGPVSPSVTTLYSVTATDANGCMDDASTTILVNPLPVVSITASDTVLHPGSSIVLIANGTVSYTWNTGSNSFSITTDSAGTYYVMGTDINNCTAWDSITLLNANFDTVSVSGFLITPNDDNINDVLMIHNLSAYSSCDLKIYNIWNDEVYSVSGYKNDWKGTNMTGGELSAGAYYYIIQCDDKPLLKGNINILR